MIKILKDEEDFQAVMYDDQSGFAFGPVFQSELGKPKVGTAPFNASWLLREFLKWVGYFKPNGRMKKRYMIAREQDPSMMTDTELQNKYNQFMDHIRRTMIEQPNQ